MIISVGDKLRVEWPTDDGSKDEFEVKVDKIKVKGQKRVYSLLFQDYEDDEKNKVVRKSDLTKITWRKILPIQDEIHDTKDVYQMKNDHSTNRLINRSGHTINKSRRVFNPILKKEYTMPDYRFIVAPMVGGSELAFRLLCRKYGATLAYTPMINSNKFAFDEEYRKEQFQTIEDDRPLVAHFAANNPNTILQAAKFVESQCDAIDINLGCPQRVAFTGHFGSFLLDEIDRPLVISMVKTLAENLTIPVFVKIRLLDTVPDTIKLCEQLIEAGVALIAIHARYRVNLVGRTGPGARDGAAHLDQVKEIKIALGYKYNHVPIITNGNVRNWKDTIENIKFTQADGIMSAEGLLDHPDLYSPSLDVKTREEEIIGEITEETTEIKEETQSLSHSIKIAQEYLTFVDLYPVPMKSVIFHIRRICRDVLTKYQLIEDVINASNVSTIQSILQQAQEYEKNPKKFQFNQIKDKKVKEALERRKQNESKRKDYEARMIRKAKREGLDLDYYLRLGSELPSVETLNDMKELSEEKSFQIWKEKYSQHCYAYHFHSNKCPRERTCAFLHVDASYLDTIAFG